MLAVVFHFSLIKLKVKADNMASKSASLLFIPVPGNDSCKWLLSDGRFPGYSVWQPYGCMIHKYTQE